MRRSHHYRAWVVGALLALATAAGAGEAMAPPEDASALALNTPAPGSLEVPGEVAWYNFTLTEPQRIVLDGVFDSTATLTLFELTESKAPSIESIFEAAERIGGETDAGIPATVSGFYLAAGTYYLRVAMEVFEGSPLAYTIEYRWIDPLSCDSIDPFEPNDAWGQAVDIAFDELQATAGLCAADRDWRRFTLSDAGRIVLTVDGNDYYENERVVATLYDASLAAIGTDIGSQVQNLPAGTYFIELRAEGENDQYFPEVDYRVILEEVTFEADAFEPDDEPTAANALEPGVSAIGHSIAPAGDEDWFAFTLTAPTTVHGVANNVTLRWFTANLTDLGAGTLAPRALDAGDYFLRVTAFEPLAHYRLDLWDDAGPDPYEDDDTIGEARRLGLGGGAEIRNFDTVDDEDWVRIAVEYAMPIAISVIAIGGDAAPVVTVFDETGDNELASGTDFVDFEVFGGDSVLVRIRNSDGAVFGAGTSYYLAAGLQEQGPLPGTIVGAVIQSAKSDALAIPVPGATVSLGAASISADQNGVFLFPDLPAPRSWSLTASAPGYAVSEPVPVFLGSRVARTTIALTPSPAPLIAVDDADRTAPWTAGNAAFAIGNGGGGVLAWSASVIEGGDWLTIATGANGVNDGTISTAYETNVAAAARTGIIQVTAPGASNSGLLLSITQDGAADGSVRVTLNPAEAVAAGARWRVDGGEWRDSGATVALAPGAYTISYSLAGGWIPPASTDVTITPEALSALDQTYAPRQAGDANGDSQVNAVDVQFVINAVLGNGAPDVDGDVNGDNQLDAADVQQMILYALGVG